MQDLVSLSSELQRHMPLCMQTFLLICVIGQQRRPIVHNSSLKSSGAIAQHDDLIMSDAGRMKHSFFAKPLLQCPSPSSSKIPSALRCWCDPLLPAPEVWRKSTTLHDFPTVIDIIDDENFCLQLDPIDNKIRCMSREQSQSLLILLAI